MNKLAYRGRSMEIDSFTRSQNDIRIGMSVYQPRVLDQLYCQISESRQSSNCQHLIPPEESKNTKPQHTSRMLNAQEFHP